MIIHTKAIVLHALKYSESDLIVTCFTETSGLKSYLLPRILKSKRAKVSASLFQPLTQLDLVANNKNKEGLGYIKEAKLTHLYKTIHTNIIKTTLVIFLAEILKMTITEEAKDQQLFVFLCNSFYWLDDHEEIANFHILFLLNLTKHLGIFPDTSDIKQPFFNMIEGNFQKNETNKFCQKGDQIELFKQFFGINFDAIHQIKINKSTRSAILNLVLTYYQLHLHAFKQPKSLQVLNQLFL